MSEVKSWTVQISGTWVTLHGPKGLKLGHHVVLKSDFDAVVKERDDLRAEMRALKDELDRTTDALIHQGKTLRKTTENLLKMSNNKDAEIQQLQSDLKKKDEMLDECERLFERLIESFNYALENNLKLTPSKQFHCLFLLDDEGRMIFKFTKEKELLQKLKERGK